MGQEERKGFVFFILKHSWAPKRSWKIYLGGPGKSWIFFVSKRVGTLYNCQIRCQCST